MAIGTDMQVKEIVCSCCKDPLAILPSDKKRWAERKQKQILYEFQALSLAMENRCFGITKPFLVIFMIFISLLVHHVRGGRSYNADDDSFVGGKHARNEVRVDMRQISFMEMERDEQIGQTVREPRICHELKATFQFVCGQRYGCVKPIILCPFRVGNCEIRPPKPSFSNSPWE